MESKIYIIYHDNKIVENHAHYNVLAYTDSHRKTAVEEFNMFNISLFV